MCGITGYVSFSGVNIRRDTLESLSDVISHRGPDDNGCFLFDKSTREFSVFRKGDQALKVSEGQVG